MANKKINFQGISKSILKSPFAYYDFFSNIQDAAFLLDDKEANPPVLIGTDSQAEYCEYLAGTFFDYVELELRCLGVEARGRTRKLDDRYFN